MARKPGIEYARVSYHVITWDNRRQNIFRDKDDFLKYPDYLLLGKSLLHLPSSRFL